MVGSSPLASAVRSMSALGQKRTFSELRAMSALPPKADIDGRKLDVRFVPIADIGKRLRMPLRMELPEGFDC
jgi:hypothetical protein